MSEYTCDISVTLKSVKRTKQNRFDITLNVHEELGQRIMDYAAMISGISPWDPAKLLDGGLRLTERGGEREQAVREIFTYIPARLLGLLDDQDRNLLEDAAVSRLKPEERLCLIEAVYDRLLERERELTRG